eukprot:scaffold147162_cov74-Cyclotella_meneghiniana.AAC.5
MTGDGCVKKTGVKHLKDTRGLKRTRIYRFSAAPSLNSQHININHPREYLTISSCRRLYPGPHPSPPPNPTEHPSTALTIP